MSEWNAIGPLFLLYPGVLFCMFINFFSRDEDKPFLASLFCSLAWIVAAFTVFWSLLVFMVFPSPFVVENPFTDGDVGSIHKPSIDADD